MYTLIPLLISLKDYALHTISNGFVLAMAAVCMLEYVLYLVRTERQRKAKEFFKHELEGLSAELDVVHRERTMTKLENRILRDFMSESESSRAIDLLLKQFVPNAAVGFAAIVDLRSSSQILQTRGLSSQGAAEIKVDDETREALRRDRHITLDGRALFESSLIRNMTSADRAKIRELFLIAICWDGELGGMLLTTQLVPSGAPKEQQLELGSRLMMSLAGNLRRNYDMHSQQQQLQQTNDMLELRAIADQRSEHRLDPLKQFLQRLVEKLGVDRGAVYYTPFGRVDKPNRILKCGSSLQAGVREKWQGFEDRLTQTGLGLTEVEFFNASTLKSMRIDALIGGALVVPLFRDGLVCGVMSLTRGGSAPFSKSSEELAAWAGELLAEKLVRAINDAVVERNAKLDGLTQLANRRTFDDRFAREFPLEGECSLILMDIDRFKRVNDTYGHLAGDQVLRTVSRVIRECVQLIRSSDRALCARYGGEELVVLLPGVNLDGAVRIAETIRASVERAEIFVDDMPIHVTLSAGVSSGPRFGTVPEELIAAADSALYQAKLTGRNRVWIPGKPTAAPQAISTPVLS